MKYVTGMTILVLTAILLSACASPDNKPLTAQGVFDRYIEQAYGRKGLEGNRSVTLKGKLIVENFGVEAPVTVKQMAPNSRMLVVEVMGMSGNEGCHKGECWSKQPGQGLQLLSGDILAFQQQFADFYQYTRLDQYYASTEVMAEPPDANTIGVRLVRENGDEDYYYFSRETGLLVASKIQALTVLGKIPVEGKYQNYQDFSGVQVPVIYEESSPLATTKIIIEDVSFDQLTDADFARPE